MADQLTARPRRQLGVPPNGGVRTVRQVDGATTRMVRAELASGNPDIGLLWELCLRVEYESEVLVEGLAGWLGPPAGVRVLDSACGSGFPALELLRRGYEVTCSDGSPEMLERFRRNAARVAVAVRAECHRWDELSNHYASAFDVVLCRGSSLIYAGTWEQDTSPSRAALRRSVESLVQCVRPGGRMYVDTTRAEDLAVGSLRSRNELVLADGERIVIEERLETDLRERVRSWTTAVSSSEASFSFRRYSHYLPHGELVHLLTQAGLRAVRHVEIPGEHYDVFTGERAHQ